MRNEVIIFVLFLLIASVNGQESESLEIDVKLGERCSPIVLVPGSQTTLITHRMFVEEDYEIAIFPSLVQSSEYFFGYVIRKSETGYLCYVKKIRVDDVRVGNRVSKDAVNECKIDVTSSNIKNESVEILSKFLRTKVKKASYLLPEGENRLVTVDGQAYDIYIRGSSDDEFNHYSARVVDPVEKNGQSCSTIIMALMELGSKEPGGIHGNSVDKLTIYLRSILDGKKPQSDPFVDPSREDEEINIDLPN